MRTRAAKTAIVALLILLIATCFAIGVSAQSPIVIRIGHNQPPDQELAKSLVRMAERIQERTNGRVEVRIFPAGQLGSGPEIIEQAEMGSVEITEITGSQLSTLLDDFSIFDAPFIFDDEWHAHEFGRSDMVQAMAKKLLDQYGLRILDISVVFGPRHLSTKNTPVRKPEDLKGLKIRVHEAQTRVDMINAWGATPVVTATAEMYMALQTGLADGQESPLSWQRDQKYWEVQKYVMKTGHFIQNNGIAINEQFYQRLPDDIKQILVEEAAKMAEEATANYIRANQEAEADLVANGMIIVDDVDIAAFRKASEKMWDKWEHRWGAGAPQKVINREYRVLSPEEWINY
ncbi:MAG: TRAP transporter substrate-binding protein [Firmicutes bacterium]|nr:TRAP transporter substrate-binding protein [Bacillota bacterium]